LTNAATSEKEKIGREQSHHTVLFAPDLEPGGGRARQRHMKRHTRAAAPRRVALALAGVGVCLLGAAACGEADADDTREDTGGTAAPPAAQERSHAGELSCARPSGGWIVDRAKTSEPDWVAAMERAEELGDDTFAGVWVEYIDPEAEFENADRPSADYSNSIVVAAYTTGPHAHEAALRELWGGGLCLVEAERTYAELEEVRDALMDEFPEINGAGPDASGNIVSAMTPEITPELRAAIDERFGEGVVTLEEGVPTIAAAD
jgi:hypothetical protein